ncbi:MAG: hypothetical protein FJY25_13010 [Betaproteobacteria bacterium]|nr:hypothetical protein [Betaproteobacteria bacterium]
MALGIESRDGVTDLADGVWRLGLCGLDVEELLGRADRGLLVRSLEALGIGPALDEAADLPIPAGVGLEDA